MRIRFKYDADPSSVTMSEPETTWDGTVQEVFDLHDDILLNIVAAEDILQDLIDMNSMIGYYDKEDLGVAAMKTMDMRVDMEDAVNMINQSLAKFEMITFALKTMEAQIRDNLPEFKLDYEEYKKYINEERYGTGINFSEIALEDNE